MNPVRFRGMRLPAARFVAASAILLCFGGSIAQAQEVTVSINNFTFTPPELTVKVGDTVTWTNRDDIPHTVVSAGKFIGTASNSSMVASAMQSQC